MGISVLNQYSGSAGAAQRAVRCGREHHSSRPDAGVGVRAGLGMSIDGLESNRNGQLVVQSTLQTTRDAAVFAMGDCAACPVEPGSAHYVAASAQAAHQQAALLVTNMQRRLAGQTLLDFRFKDKGTLVSIASHNTFGRLFGTRVIEGPLARFFYYPSIGSIKQRSMG